MSYKDKRIRKQKKFSRSFSLAMMINSIVQEGFEKELFSHTNLSVLN